MTECGAWIAIVEVLQFLTNSARLQTLQPLIIKSVPNSYHNKLKVYSHGFEEKPN